LWAETFAFPKKRLPIFGTNFAEKNFCERQKCQKIVADYLIRSR